MTSLSILDVSKSYGAAQVLAAFNIKIGDGTFFTLLGPSGCGKTTLLRIVAGFVAPDTGAVRFGEEDVTHLAPHKRDVGMVFQDYALFPDKTVFENVAYGLRARSVAAPDIRKRVLEHLEMVDLAHLADRNPAQLSGGQRQRVALARALVIGPRVLLMDEPLSNLDAKLRVQMREMIRDLQQAARITTVFVTHDQEEALALSDQVAVMKGGHVEQLGTPRQIYARPTTQFVAEFVGAANLLPATCKEVRGDGEVVCDVLGRRVTGHCQGPGASSELTLVARPEAVVLRPGDCDPASCGAVNCLPGRTVRQQYLGYKTSYVVSLAGDHLMTVDVPATDRTDTLPTNTDVHVDLGPSCLFVGGET